MGLGSRLGKSKDLSPSWRAKLRRLQKWHQRARAISHKDKSLRKGLINLDKLCGDLFLPKSLKAEVSILFRKARKKKVTSGRNTWSVLAALIFMVGRMRRIPRTEKEIARVLSKRTKFNEKEAISSLRRARKVLSRELNLEVPRPRAKEYLDRFSSNLNLSGEALTEAHEMCASLPEKFKNRKASYLVAASLIYNASRRVEGGVKIREIAEVLNVGTSSVSKTGQKIRDLVRNSEE